MPSFPDANKFITEYGLEGEEADQFRKLLINWCASLTGTKLEDLRLELWGSQAVEEEHRELEEEWEALRASSSRKVLEALIAYLEAYLATLEGE